MKKLLYLLATAALLLPWAGQAAYFEGKDIVTLTNEVNDDVYLAGKWVRVDKKIGGDIHAAGETIEVNGPSAGDVIAVGNTVDIKNDVGDDILTAGNNVEISAPKVQDIMAAGNTVKIDSTTNSTGSAYLAGSTVEIDGKINGTVRVASPSVLVRKSAVISGDLITYGETEPQLQVEDGAVIKGQRRFVQVAAGRTSETPSKSAIAKLGLLSWVGSVIMMAVCALIALYGLPTLSRRIIETANNKPVLSFAVGILWAMLMIPVTILLFVTYVGVPLGFLAIVASLLFLVAAFIYVNITAGSWLSRWLLKQGTSAIKWQHVLLGTVVLSALSIIPIIGWLVAVIAGTITFGSIILVIFDFFRGRQTTTTSANA